MKIGLFDDMEVTLEESKMGNTTKVQFKVSLPNEFEADEKNTSFPQSDLFFHQITIIPKSKCWLPEEDSKSRYRNVSFNLSNNLKDGTLSLS